MDTNQLIQFGILALLVVVIAIAMRRGQTVQPPARGANESTQTGDPQPAQGDAPEDTVSTGGRKNKPKR